MKIIHCADLHLDSKLSANFDKDKAKERSRELLRNFTRLVSYAVENEVSAILIAGDLFDTKVISKLTINTIREAIVGNSQIDFYYLKGNHDRDNFLSSLEDIPANLKLFSDTWTEYVLGSEIHLYGVELTSDNALVCQENFYPNPSDINIVMLHGQDSQSISKDKAETINLKYFRNKGINYMALGHIHKYFRGELDSTGKYCYSGCLEARGFDECGEHGFVLLNIDDNTVKDTFIPFAMREFHEINVDISNLSSTVAIIEEIKHVLADIPSKDMVKIVLTGEKEVEAECDTAYISGELSKNYYLFKIYDESKIRINYSDFILDKSLKGAFVRCVNSSDVSEEEKGEIIKYGFQAISGGEII